MLKKKYIGLFFLFGLLAPVTLSYVWLQYRRSQLRREVKHRIMAGMDESELQLFEFSRTEIEEKAEWKNPHEFRLGHEMYDVVHREENGDEIRLWCWRDHKEAQLEEQIKDLLAFAMGHDPEKNENKRRLNRFFKSLFYSAIPEWQVIEHPEVRPHFHYSFTCKLFESPPPVPPPQMA